MDTRAARIVTADCRFNELKGDSLNFGIWWVKGLSWRMRTCPKGKEPRGSTRVAPELQWSAYSPSLSSGRSRQAGMALKVRRRYRSWNTLDRPSCSGRKDHG